MSRSVQVKGELDKVIKFLKPLTDAAAVMSEAIQIEGDIERNKKELVKVQEEVQSVKDELTRMDVARTDMIRKFHEVEAEFNSRTKAVEANLRAVEVKENTLPVRLEAVAKEVDKEYSAKIKEAEKVFDEAVDAKKKEVSEVQRELDTITNQLEALKKRFS
jgi:uncharacterized protein YukE